MGSHTFRYPFWVDDILNGHWAWLAARLIASTKLNAPS
jgi:hypothetical protein